MLYLSNFLPKIDSQVMCHYPIIWSHIFQNNRSYTMLKHQLEKEFYVEILVNVAFFLNETYDVNSI